jgi:endonuclease/exonuclease/phosphatase family metal-dependent hydrolase
MPYYKPIKTIRDEVTKKRVIENLLNLRGKLSDDVPAKTVTETLLLATWNIREFGDNRTDESLHYIAEIISRFDLVAIQEVGSSLAGIEKLLYFLGKGWNYLVTDTTDGSTGGSERMAFVYDESKVRFTNLAGEIVLPKNKLIDNEQLARTPFCVSFQAGWFKFVLTTVHIYFGKPSGPEFERRVNEIRVIAETIKKRAKKEDTNYILLGDFNIVNPQDETFKALTDNKFFIPENLMLQPTDIKKSKHYDQIAFNVKEDVNMLIFKKNQQEQKAGAFSFFDVVYKDADAVVYKDIMPKRNTENSTEKQIERYFKTYYRTFQLSDHQPLWVELKVDFSSEYLKSIS